MSDPWKALADRYDRLLTQTGTPHSHPERVDGCFRCDLSGDEIGAVDTTPAETT